MKLSGHSESCTAKIQGPADQNIVNSASIAVDLVIVKSKATVGRGFPDAHTGERWQQVLLA